MISSVNAPEVVLGAGFTGAQDALLRVALTTVSTLEPGRTWSELSPAQQVALRIIDTLRGAHGRGIIWKGRPSWLDAKVLTDLREGAERAKPAAEWFPGGFHRFAGARDVAQALEASVGVSTFVRALVGREIGEMAANFMYYEAAGNCAYPHIDAADFALNALCLLRHESSAKPSSSLWFYPVDAEPFELTLAMGELAIFHGRAIVHGRTPVAADERVHVLSIGFTWPSTQT